METLKSFVQPHLLHAAGYTEGAPWMTRKFAGAEHNEAAWQRCVHVPLQFLPGAEPR